MDLYHIWYAVIQKWKKDLNVTDKTVMLLEENTGGNFCDLELGNGCLDDT